VVREESGEGVMMRELRRDRDPCRSEENDLLGKPPFQNPGVAKGAGAFCVEHETSTLLLERA
jgi:hypothetical protein